VSADSWVLDHCSAWVNVAARILASSIPDAEVIDL
jgi:hypothetical protein